jgi:hypothetical protein
VKVQTVDAWEERRLGLVIVQGQGPDCGGRHRPDGVSFSRHLASGLQGAADGDGDGQVRLSEAARYAARQLSSDPAQLPPGWGEQEPFLTFPRRGEAGPLSSAPGSEAEAARARRRSEALALLAAGEPAPALVTSSGADELSQEAKALRGSVFTHHLVSGLWGAADTDGDGYVMLSEAWRHGFLRTTADTAPTTLPHRPAWRLDLQRQREPVLTRLGRLSSRLRVPRGQGERYVVVDAHELRLVAEVRASPEAPAELALMPGRYQLKRVQGARLEAAELVLAPGQMVEASGLDYTSQPLAGGLLKGQPDAAEGEALHVWRRGEALRVLAAGEPGAALALFEALLKAQPTDEAARRGKARALVWLAEAYDRVGDRRRQEDALSQALQAAPPWWMIRT